VISLEVDIVIYMHQNHLILGHFDWRSVYIVVGAYLSECIMCDCIMIFQTI